ncbi:hypothetical protein ACHAXN_011951 [Cyclotella atomus]
MSRSPRSNNDKRKTLQHQPSSYESFRNRAVVIDTDLSSSLAPTSFGYDNRLTSTSNAANETINEHDESADEAEEHLELASQSIIAQPEDETSNSLRENLRKSLLPSSETPQRTALQRLLSAVQTAAVTNELLGLLNDSVAKTQELKDQVGSTSTNDNGNIKFQAAVDAITMLNRQKIPTISSHPRNAGEYTIVAFVNSASGGRKGESLFNILQQYLGEEYVVDLKSCGPGNMPEDTLVQYATDPMVRVLACGGDGTCGCIFSSLDKVWLRLLGERSPTSRIHSSKYKDHLPLAIMPLGTGNDLSRQFHWGGKFNESMTKKSMIQSVQNGKLTRLDRWRCIIMPLNALSDEEKACIPSILSGNDNQEAREKFIDELLTAKPEVKAVNNQKSRVQKQNSKVPQIPSTQFFDGVFCNYLSLGFDANIAYLFHHDREAHPERFTSPLKNKLIYVQKSPAALKAPKLKKRMKILVARKDGELCNLPIPKSCRAVILMNIRSYGGGNHLSKDGSPADGLIEVIFASNLIRTVTSVGMGKVAPFMLLNVAAQTNRVLFRTTSPLHCQVDGEPWLQSEGVIQVKFHARNAILENVTAPPRQCDCMANPENTVIQ